MVCHNQSWLTGVRTRRLTARTTKTKNKQDYVVEAYAIVHKGLSFFFFLRLIIMLLQEKTRHLFRLFDASCDGCIDAEELRRLLSRLRVTMSEPELFTLLQKMDR